LGAAVGALNLAFLKNFLCRAVRRWHFLIFCYKRDNTNILPTGCVAASVSVSVYLRRSSLYICICIISPSRSLSFRFHSYSFWFFVYFVIIATSAGIGSGLGLATSYIGLGLRHRPPHSLYSLYAPSILPIFSLLAERSLSSLSVAQPFWFLLCAGFIAVALYNCNLQWHFLYNPWGVCFIYLVITQITYTQGMICCI